MTVPLRAGDPEAGTIGDGLVALWPGDEGYPDALAEVRWAAAREPGSDTEPRDRPR